MTSATDTAIQYLQQSRTAQVAIVETAAAHLAIAPAGAYRQSLDQHVRTAREHGRAVDARLGELARGRSTVRLGVDAVWLLAGEALAAARLPWDLLRSAGSLLRGRSGSAVLLDAALRDYTVSAFALATYRALEQVARAVGDEETAKLAAALYRDQRDLTEQLLEGLDELAEALVAARVYHQDSYRLSESGAAETVRAGARRLREATGEAAETVRAEARRIPGVAEAEGEIAGAFAGAGELPIAGYDDLTAVQIAERLSQLSQVDLSRIDGYERRHAARVTVLDKVKALRAPEPWSGYDQADAQGICARLGEEPAKAGQVLEYERRHRGRAQILSVAEQLRS